MIGRAIVLSLCLLAGAALIGRASRSEQVPPRQPLADFPMDIGLWHGRPAPRFDPRMIAILGVDDYVNRLYHNPQGQVVALYIGYYASQREGATIHSPLNCLPGAGWESVKRERIALDVSSQGEADGGRRQPTAPRAVVNRIVVQKGLDRQVVLYWYQSHDRIVASEYWGKFYAVVDAIRLNRTDAALIRVISPVVGDGSSDRDAERVAVEFARTVLPVLGEYVPG
jgi:EpsI family protein